MQKIVDGQRAVRAPRGQPRARRARCSRSSARRTRSSIIDSVPAATRSSPTTQTGDWVDLCRGPHVDRTGQIKAFKLLSRRRRLLARRREEPACCSASTAPRSRRRTSSTRTSRRLEEAKRRDHRKLGKELDLFTIDETIGAGLVLWHPKGAPHPPRRSRRSGARSTSRSGYELVSTPHIARDELWKTRATSSFYKENMFRGMDVDGQQYLVKPMNCPFHFMIFKKRPRSYRELPLPLAEFGTVYRYERSGELHGLIRVRGFTQDDAHLF